MLNKGLFMVFLFCFIWIACSQTDWQHAKSPLTTRWTKDVSPKNVWSEYPRPIMERKNWLNLNGLWEYAIRPVDSPQPTQFDGNILVPFPLESALSGVAKRISEDSLIWYQTIFNIPSDWRKNRILLHFEAVDWETKIWLNDRQIGIHKGGYDPFYFDVTDYLFESEQQKLVVSVWDPADKGFQPRGKQVSKPRGIYYTPSTGIWQTVWLEPVPQSFIQDVQIIPDIDQDKVTITTNVDNHQIGDRIKLLVFDQNGEEIVSASEQFDTAIQVTIDNAQLWSPDSPYLYDVKIQLIRDNQVMDQVDSYVGMRKSSLGKDENGITRLLLNNEFVFQLGPLDQGFFPDGLHTPPTDAAMKYDIEMVKKLGFNMLRKHVKIESRRFYTWCDKLGILVWQDMPSRNRPNEDDRIIRESDAQFEFELKQMIKTKFNHPSIVMWVPFNEGWGQYDTPRIVQLIKKLDPTRLVNNASGWTDKGVGDVMDIHRYPGPAAPNPEKNRAAVLGEFGGLGYNMPGHMWQEEGWGYALFQDREALTSKYEEILQGVFAYIDDPGLSAAVYTQTSDIETENNGLMTYDREMIKIAPAALTLANQGHLPPVLVDDARIFIDDYQVTLTSACSDANIVYTLDENEPTKDATVYSEPFTINKTTTIKTRCFWADGTMSRVRSYSISKVDPINSTIVEHPTKGLQLDYFEGNWDLLPDYSQLVPLESKTVSKIDLSASPKDRHYALRFEGFFNAPKTGVYSFYIRSDDGSRFFIHDEQIIDNDGIHGAREKVGTVALEKGYHAIKLHFFQRTGGEYLKTSYKGPGIKKQEISADLIWHEK